MVEVSKLKLSHQSYNILILNRTPIQYIVFKSVQNYF